MNRLTHFAILCMLCISAPLAYGDDRLRPFFLASNKVANYEETIQNVKKSLRNEGFEIVNEFSPYQGTTIVIVTNKTLQKVAVRSLNTSSCKGSVLVAVQRVSITKVRRKIQIAYTDPVYMAAAYRVDENLEGQRNKLARALGRQKYFGSADGMSVGELGNYHYTFGMEYCDEYSGRDLNSGPLNVYRNHRDAVRTVNRSLQDNLGGTFKVFQVNLHRSNITIFGVGFRENDFSSDAQVMGIIDAKELRHTPHLPYEIFVIDNKAWALHPRFRIAINFPDLEMAGENSFMEIINSPDAISKNLIRGAGGEYDEDEDDFDDFDDF